MKLVLAFLILCTVNITFSQDIPTELQRIKTPTSPASVVTGTQPTVLLSPKSYNALETALYNNFTDGGSLVIPNDFGIEFSPYWSKSQQPRISLDDYLFPTFGQSFRMNSSFSLASTQNFLLGDSSKSNAIGFGWRTSIRLSGDDDKELVTKYLDSIHLSKSLRNDIISLTIDQFESENKALTTGAFLDSLKPQIASVLSTYGVHNSKSLAEQICAYSSDLPILDTNNKGSLIPIQNVLLTRIGSAVPNEVLNEFRKYLQHRKGWYLDIAAASMLNFPTKDFEFSYIPKNAFWITPSYNFVNDSNTTNLFKLMGVYRFEWHNTDFYRTYFPNSTVYINNHDFGLAFMGDFKKCSFQFELVGRYSNTDIPAGTDGNNNILYIKKQSSDVQSVLTLNYRLTNQMILTYNIGNRFDPILNPESTLISNLSLSIGFGTPDARTIDLSSLYKN